MRCILFVILLSGAWGFTSPAGAHATSTSYLSVETPEAGDNVPLRWDLALHDLVWSVHIDQDYDQVVTWQELQDARVAIESAVLSQLSVARGGANCDLRVDDLALASRESQNFLSVMVSGQCPQPGRLRVTGGLFMTGDASQRVLLSLSRGSGALTGVISAAAPAWDEPERISAWHEFARFVGEGVWHVLIGYDHIAFVLLLLLPSVLRPVNGQWRGAEHFREVLRDIVTIVTAFTIAHSTTLALAITEVVRLPAQPIELAIAASIAVAAAINLLPKLSGLRLPLAFGFGLVHGFGFANVLSEIDAQGSALLPLLAGFNIGVELAQLAIVALVLPPIYFARTRRWYAGAVMPLGSCALGAAGVVWLVQRL